MNVSNLEDFGRVRLSKNFFMREFLYSEIANVQKFSNIPEKPELAIQAGRELCVNLLEPLQHVFGRVSLRSCYRSKQVNEFGNVNKVNCATNESNYAHHIWDEMDENGNWGATACIMLPNFIDEFDEDDSWKMLAWWIHDNLEYSSLKFFKDKNSGFAQNQNAIWAFNINWRTNREKIIGSFRGATPEFSKNSLANAGHNNIQKWEKICEKFPLARAFSFENNRPNYLPK